MPEQYVRANGIRLAYEEFGHDDHPAIILMMGLGTQLNRHRQAYTRRYPQVVRWHGTRFTRAADTGVCQPDINPCA